MNVRFPRLLLPDDLLSTDVVEEIKKVVKFGNIVLCSTITKVSQPSCSVISSPDHVRLGNVTLKKNN